MRATGNAKTKCQTCESTDRVVSVSVCVRYCGSDSRSTVIHLCESCLLWSYDLAKIATEVQGGALTIAETMDEGPKRTVNNVLSYLSLAATDAYRKLRGGA
jgi:hypothetical protein